LKKSVNKLLKSGCFFVPDIYNDTCNVTTTRRKC
jgi:hypothetical protein